MRTYIPDQWLRLWFLGGPEFVSTASPKGQLEHTGAKHFAAEMRRVWKNVAPNNEDARLVIRYGGIHDRDAEPMDVLKAVACGLGLADGDARRLCLTPTPVADRFASSRRSRRRASPSTTSTATFREGGCQ